MRFRDPDEERAATPLELLYDLAFVVAVGFAADDLQHAVSSGQLALAITRYLMVFFAIWWTWINYSHFASVYDTDDLPYRVLTVIQIGGVLVIASGIGPAFTRADFTMVAVGYVIIRLALVGQWIRAAVEYPPARSSSLRFAIGVFICQLGWIGQLFLPLSIQVPTYLVMVIAELSVPIWAETAGTTTRWHPGHLAERYGLFVLIVLGEQVVSSANAIIAGLAHPDHLGSLIVVAASGLLILFALWWLYFDNGQARLVGLTEALAIGYGHYFVLASIAAVGAGIEVGITVALGHTSIGQVAAGSILAVPVAVYLVAVWLIFRLAWARQLSVRLTNPVAAVLVLLAGLTPLALPLVAAILVLTVLATLATSTPEVATAN
jgi:low temperature requirement protein LtrA